MCTQRSLNVHSGIVNPRLRYSRLQVVFCVNLGTFFKCFLQLGWRLTGVRSTLTHGRALNLPSMFTQRCLNVHWFSGCPAGNDVRFSISFAGETIATLVSEADIKASVKASVMKALNAASAEVMTKQVLNVPCISPDTSANEHGVLLLGYLVWSC
jgi:hypothetical protein